MITRCCKRLCHKYSNDKKLDASHLGVIAGLYLSLVVKNDNGNVFTPESVSLLLAVILHTSGMPGTESLHLMTF